MIYRVHFETEGGTSAGYKYFTRKRVAETAAARWRRSEDERASVTAAAETPKTLKDVVRLLNEWASHPDNG